MKRATLETLKKAIDQHVLVTYRSQGKTHQIVAKLLEVDFSGIAIAAFAGRQAIGDNDIIDITIKNLSFINPRTYFLNTQEERSDVSKLMDALTTKTIEHIKKLDTYTLMLRYATFTKNGSLEKQRHKKSHFEIEVFKWIKKPQHVVQLCPLALLNNTLLLAIYMKKFIIFKRNLSIVFADDDRDIQHIIDFIFEHNDKITEQRGKSLRLIAEDLL